MQDITVQELKERMDAGTAPIMIDVREPFEWDMNHLDGVQKISMGDIPAKVSDLADWKDKELVIVCRSGGRSGRISEFLRQEGFSNIRNLTGGMLAWKRDIDSSFNVE
ncbi:MAG: rhodanese-like domain-containing protein [Bacteroidia bacterium]|nr:rhodanese-like domain-containing protein [Bacteroidia bacterium]